MKTSFKVLLPMALLLALPAVVQAELTFTTNNSLITITGYTGSGGAVTIPDTTNGLLVTRIGMRAFPNQTSVTLVTIPDSVINVGNNTFYNCTGLTSVISIGGTALQSDTSLTSITIPDKVTSIGTSTFAYCSSLTNVVIGTQPQELTE